MLLPSVFLLSCGLSLMCQWNLPFPPLICGIPNTCQKPENLGAIDYRKMPADSHLGTISPRRWHLQYLGMKTSLCSCRHPFYPCPLETEKVREAREGNFPNGISVYWLNIMHVLSGQMLA